MITIKEVKDPWFNLRQNLYKNTEPLVELLGITTMFETEQDLFDFISGQTEESRNVPIIAPDRIPGRVASMSHMSEKTPEGEVKLTKNLLKMKPGKIEAFWSQEKVLHGIIDLADRLKFLAKQELIKEKEKADDLISNTEGL